jgi:hypothetical protein
MSSSAPSATAKKTATRKTTTPARPTAGAGSRGGQLNGSQVRHGKIADPVWDALTAKAESEGRGPWEVLRQLASEYAAGRHDRCSPGA